MRLSLKVKAAAAITLLFLGVMALIASVETRYIRAGLVEKVAGQQTALVAAVAKGLDQKLQTNLLALTSEALVIPAAILAQPQELQNYLDGRPAMLLLFDSLVVYSPTGEVLADSPQIAGRAGIQVGDREYFKRSLATRKPVISTPYLGRAAQRPTVTMTAPILDKDGRLVGFLGGALDLLKDNFLGRLTTTNLGKTGYFFVITKDHPSIYVVHPDPGLILKPSTGAGAMPTNERALAGQEGTIEAVDGQRVPGLFSYKSLGTANWLLATNYPMAEALAPVVAAEARLWRISAILATLVAPLVWVLTWYLIAPLLRLHDDVQRLRRGAGVIAPNLQARQDEIGDLARDFHALIAERQRSADALRQSEARFRGAAESALDAFFVLDSVRDAAGRICDFRFVYLNANAERLLSKPAAHVVGQLLCELLPAQRGDGQFAKYTEVVETGIPLDEEFTTHAGGAGAAWLHHQVVRLEDGIAVTSRDISARKAAEEELRSNRTFLQSLIDNLPVAIYVKDVRRGQFGNMVVWNKVAELIGGIPEQQALGRKDKDIFEPDLYREIEAHDRKLLASPMVYDLPEHPFRRADGTLSFLHTISVPLFGIDNNPEFILRISDDVTSRRRQQKELRARTAELLTVSDASPLGMFRTDVEGRCTYVNRSYELISGLSADEALGDGWTRAIHAEERGRIMRQWKAAVDARQPFVTLLRYQHRDGRVLWASVRAACVVADGNVVGYVGSVDDITARRDVEHALQASEDRLRTIADTIPACVAYIDRQEVFRFTNVAFERTFGVTREEVRGRTIRDVLGEAGYEKVKPYLRRVFGGQSVTFERELRVADGVRWMEATYTPELDTDNNEVISFHALLRDVTEQKLEEQRLLRLSQIDSLTGLANRVGFEQRLSDAMTESRITGQALAVMYLDIDHFKQINDTRGHAAGDALLRAFAQRLRNSLRNTDMVARLGGDEFVVVMERMLEPRTAARLAAQALKEIRRPFALADHGASLSVTASIGIAFFDGGATTAGQLVAEADAMLYAAKKRGRNKYCITQRPQQAHASEALLH